MIKIIGQFAFKSLIVPQFDHIVMFGGSGNDGAMQTDIKGGNGSCMESSVKEGRGGRVDVGIHVVGKIEIGNIIIFGAKTELIVS